MFDAKNDSVASYATISPFEGTLNIICVAQNDAGSSHRLGSPLELSYRLQEAPIAYSSLLLMWLICLSETLQSEICLTTDVSYVITQRCILIKFDEHGNLLTWIRPETLMPTEFGSLSASEIMSKTEVIIDAELPSLWVKPFYRCYTISPSTQTYFKGAHEEWFSENLLSSRNFVDKFAGNNFNATHGLIFNAMIYST